MPMYGLGNALMPVLMRTLERRQAEQKEEMERQKKRQEMKNLMLSLGYTEADIPADLTQEGANILLGEKRQKSVDIHREKVFDYGVTQDIEETKRKSILDTERKQKENLENQGLIDEYNTLRLDALKYNINMPELTPGQIPSIGLIRIMERRIERAATKAGQVDIWKQERGILQEEKAATVAGKRSFLTNQGYDMTSKSDEEVNVYYDQYTRKPERLGATPLGEHGQLVVDRATQILQTQGLEALKIAMTKGTGELDQALNSIMDDEEFRTAFSTIWKMILKEQTKQVNPQQTSAGGFMDTGLPQGGLPATGLQYAIPGVIGAAVSPFLKK